MATVATIEKADNGFILHINGKKKLFTHFNALTEYLRKLYFGEERAA